VLIVCHTYQLDTLLVSTILSLCSSHAFAQACLANYLQESLSCVSRPCLHLLCLVLSTEQLLCLVLSTWCVMC
jgi:hypothetical protein